MPATNAATIRDALRDAGLSRGDHLLVHSSLRSIGEVDGGAEAVIDGLLDAVGPEGTLAMPTFNYTRPTPQPYFDPATTPGKTGLLTELFRKRPNAQRSRHPSHSVAMIGARAGEFTREHKQSFGLGSPIDKLAGAGGYVLLIGVTHTSNSTIHVGDTHAGVVRFWWEDTDPPVPRVLQPDGSVIEHPIDTTSSCSAAFNVVELPMRERGLVRDLRVGGAVSFLMRGRDVIETVVRLNREKPGILFCSRAGCRPCRLAREHLKRLK